MLNLMELQLMIVKYFIKKLIKQGIFHKVNTILLYRFIDEIAQDEFNEESRTSTRVYLDWCYNDAKKLNDAE